VCVSWWDGPRYQSRRSRRERPTISAWLNRRLDIPDALDGDTVLVIAIDELVLQLANLIDQNTQFIRNVRDIFIAFLAPDR
jgi:hypothetical protein